MQSFSARVQSALITLILLLSVSCAQQAKAPAGYPTNTREYQIGSYLWFQTSGEYRALSYQAYNLGKVLLERDLENKYNGKRAVVFDIDETVLDNSFGGAWEVQNNIAWDQENFNRWVALKKAEAIPGVREFIQFAVQNRVEPIFISNRSENQKEDTLLNFKRLNIPVKKENMYFLNGDWSKESRRQAVLSKYHVVLYFGDNLGDFHKDWDNKTAEERRALVDQHREDFGEKFIILPNPLYGDWEKSLPKNVKRTDLLKTIPE
jgi:5'-nucleotidase (lipoprotein e(P4) family)